MPWPTAPRLRSSRRSVRCTPRTSREWARTGFRECFRSIWTETETRTASHTTRTETTATGDSTNGRMTDGILADPTRKESTISTGLPGLMQGSIPFSSFQPRTIRLGCSASSTTGRDTLPPTIQRSARTLLLSSSSPVAFMKSGCGQTACRLSSMLRRSSVFSAFCPRNTAGRISLYRKRVGPPADTPTFLRRV